MARHADADRLTVGIRARGFIDDGAAGHHQHPVSQFEQFVKVLADQQHGGAAIAGGDDLAVNVGDGGEVQSEDGVGAAQHVHIAGKFARQHGALDVAAGERADRRVAAGGAHVVAFDQVAGLALHGAPAQQHAAADGRAVEIAEGHVLGDAHAGHAGVAQRLLRQQGEFVPPDFGARGGKSFAGDGDQPFVPALAGQNLHQRGLAVAGDAGDADDLAAPYV